MTAALCQIGAIVAAVVAANTEGQAWKLLYQVLTFGAVVVSLVCLILTAVVWKSRIEKPPRPLVFFAVAVSCFPYLMLLLGSLI